MFFVSAIAGLRPAMAVFCPTICPELPRRVLVFAGYVLRAFWVLTSADTHTKTLENQSFNGNPQTQNPRWLNKHAPLVLLSEWQHVTATQCNTAKPKFIIKTLLIPRSETQVGGKGRLIFDPQPHV